MLTVTDVKANAVALFSRKQNCSATNVTLIFTHFPLFYITLDVFNWLQHKIGRVPKLRLHEFFFLSSLA